MQCILSYQLTCYANSYRLALVFTHMSTPWLFMCEPVAFHQQSLQKVTYSHTQLQYSHTNMQQTVEEEEARREKERGNKRPQPHDSPNTHTHACNIV